MTHCLGSTRFLLDKEKKIDAETEKQERKRDRIEERSAGEEDSMQIVSKECRQIKFEMMEIKKEELDKIEREKTRQIKEGMSRRARVRLTEKEIMGGRKILTKSDGSSKVRG